MEEDWTVNNDKEGDLSQAQVASVDGQDVAGGGRDEGGVGAQEHRHANLTCGHQHIHFPLKIQIKKRTCALWCPSKPCFFFQKSLHTRFKV